MLGISSHAESSSIEEDGSEWVAPLIYKKDVRLEPKRVSKYIMPDLTGMGLKDATYLLENAGLLVKAEGFGKVKNQSVQPGTKIIKGSSIHLTLG
jgi:cell division protein FtsI (penicillin-binding protein 3)